MSKIITSISRIGAGTLISLLMGLITTKVIAIAYGPEGVGLFSMIKQAIQSSSSFGLGAQSAIVQGVASRIENDQRNYIKTAFLIYLIGTLISVLIFVIYFFNFAPDSLKSLIKNNVIYFYIICISSIVTSLYCFYKSLLNGLRLINKLILVELIGPLTLSIIIVISYAYGYDNILFLFSFAFLASQTCMLLIGIFFSRNHHSACRMMLEISFSIFKINAKSFLKVSSLSIGATLVSGACLFQIRYNIITTAGLETGAFFDAAWTICNGYIMLLLGAFGTFYLPTLAAENDLKNRSFLIKKIFRLSIILSTAMICSITLFKSSIITILYSDKFIPSLDLMQWMLIGDYFKVGAWVFALTSIARGKIFVFFLTECAWWGSLLVFSLILKISAFNLEIIAVFYLILYVALFIFYLWHAKKNHNISLTGNDWWLFGMGAISIILISLLAWGRSYTPLFTALLCLIFVGLIIFFSITKIERASLKDIYLRFSTKLLSKN